MSANATTPRQAGQTPPTAEEAGRIIEALRARIEEKEGESERLKADRNALSEAIAAKEVDDAVGLQPYADGEKKKHFTAMNTLDAQIGQSETTLERLRERLAQAEHERAVIEMQAALAALPPLRDRIHAEAVRLKGLVDEVRALGESLRSLYFDYDMKKGEYAQSYLAANPKMQMGEGELAYFIDTTDTAAVRSIPPEFMPYPLEDSFDIWWLNIRDQLSPARIKFLELTRAQLEAQGQS